MLTATFLVLALAASGLAQIPQGYRTVYLTSMVDPTFVIVPKSAASGSTIVVQTRNNTPSQQWYLQNGNSSIQLANTTLCLDAGAKSNWKDMATISLATCAASTDSQSWNVMADGRIALAASKPQECVDLQYMRATANNPVGLYSCAGLNNAGAADKGINWPTVNVTV